MTPIRIGILSDTHLNQPSARFQALVDACFAGAAMILHKVMDGFTLTSVFQQAGYSQAGAWGGLAFMAAAPPLGAAVSAAGVAALNPAASAVLLGVAGGSFLYLSAAEFAPRLYRPHDFPAFLSFGGGVLCLWALRSFLH